MNQDPSFGTIVKERRNKLGLTQTELARRVGCAPVTIRKIEYDALRPSVQIAEHLAVALNIPEEEHLAFVRLARRERDPSPIPTPPPEPEEIGREDLSGRALKGFQLGERVGAGGYGAVYRAVQTTVERDVAIKIILPKYADQPEFIRRFEAEAQLVAQLEHPHIVPLYDYWREPGVAYLVMRFLRGGSLEDRLMDGPLAIDTILPVLEQICAGLHAAHRAGVIHRDIKPANILLDEDGNAYLADFGIAKNLAQTNGGDQFTGEAVIGSPAYISPEQIMAERVKPQTDIYSLGVMLFELLTGRKPFKGPTPIAYIQQHLNERLPLLSTTHNGDVSNQTRTAPTPLDVVIGRATAKHPQERYPDILSLLADLRQAIQPDSTVADVADSQSVTTTPPHIAAMIELPDMENPYKGLRAFDEADAADFFGRDTLVQALLVRMGEESDVSRFLAVVGPSGSGKSSVVKAGLMPALRQGGLPGSEKWFIVEMIPGPNPLEELEAALLRVAVNPPDSLLAQLREDERGLLRAVNRILPADYETELVLVIDQFEEIFTLVEDEDLRAHLLDSLVSAVLDTRSRLRVVITIRADFTDRPLQYVDFGELVRQQTEFVLPLTPDELELTITGPTKRAGLALEAGLVPTIIGDIGDQPGMLPLLQYALTELFERRDGRNLTLAAYQESGGVLGALARRANELYDNLAETAQEAARQLFLRLVTLGEGTEDTRRRVLRSELAGMQTAEVLETSAVLERVIDQFGRYRLLTFDHDPVTRSPTIEVAHEALLREWSRLRGWLDESRADVRLQRLLASAAEEWLGADRDPDYLLRGSRLDQFEGWAVSTNLALTQNERAYLDDSLAARQEREVAEEARLQRELETAQRLAETEKRRAEEQTQAAGRLRWLAAGLAVFLLAAIAAAWLALNQQTVAQRNAAEAETNRIEAEKNLTQAEANQAEAEANLALAERNAAESQNQALIAGSQAALASGNTDEAIALAMEAVKLNPNSTNAQVALGEAAYTPGTMRHIETPEGEVTSIVFSADGQTALTTNWDQSEVWLRDMQSGEIIQRFEGHQGGTNDAIFIEDGQMALSVSEDQSLILWDVETGESIRQFEGHKGWINDVDLSPDGQTALSGADDDNTPILWDIQTGEIIRRFGEGGEGHTDAAWSVAFSPDGQTVISGSRDTTMILWDVETGQIIRRFGANGEGHAASIVSVALSPDGSQILSSAEETDIILWDVATGEVIRRFQGHSGWVNEVAFSPDGHHAFSAGGDNSVILWDVATGQPISRYQGHVDGVYGIAFVPDGRSAFSGAGDNTMRQWDLEAGQVIRRFPGHAAWTFRAVRSPDGRRVLTSSMDGTAILWDVETGEEIRRYISDVSIPSVSFSPDGRMALLPTGFMIDEPYDVVLWDVETGEEIRRFTGHPDGVVWTTFSPDGQTAATGGATGTIILWDVATGQEIRRFEGYETEFIGPSVATHSLAFSPDGQTLMSGFGNGTLVLWAVATGQEIRQFEGHSHIVGEIIFSPDGQHAFTGSWDNTAIYWDVATGEIVHHFTDHSASVYQVALTPDGRYGLGGSADNTTTLWDMETGEVIRRYSGSKADVFSIAFGPDGRDAVVTFFDGGVELWRIDAKADELVTWTENNRYIPELTCNQRALYKLEPLCAE